MFEFFKIDGNWAGFPTGVENKGEGSSKFDGEGFSQYMGEHGGGALNAVEI